MEATIAGKYKISKKIGEGSFGEIFIGMKFISHQHIHAAASSSKDCTCVIRKTQPSDSPNCSTNTRYTKPSKEHVSAYTAGIPNAEWFGTEGQFNIMAMQYLGPNLEELFQFCKKKFTVKTTLMIADQLVTS